MVAFSDIQRLADQVASTFRPDQIILFGSHATGTAREDSDVDLLVLIPFEGKPFWKSLEILNAVNPSFPVDLIARDTADAKRRYEQLDPLIRDAMDHGKVLYDRRG